MPNNPFHLKLKLLASLQTIQTNSKYISNKSTINRHYQFWNTKIETLKISMATSQQTDEDIAMPDIN